MAARGWTVKQGAILTRSYDDGPMRDLRLAMLEAAHEDELPNGLMVITDGWRKSIRPNGVDLHSFSLALDIRANNLIVGRGRSRADATWAWVARARGLLNDDRFQFLAHGQGASWHVHGEWDPR